MATRRKSDGGDSGPNTGPRHYTIDFSLGGSLGYLVRDANRAFQRLLEKRISPHGVTRGQWYFLRVLWEEDGLSQRELSARVGMMEPTTVIALRSMEKAGLVRRSRSIADRRVTRVHLTAKAQAAARAAAADLARRERPGRGGHRSGGPDPVPPRDRADDEESRPHRAVGRCHSGALAKRADPEPHDACSGFRARASALRASSTRYGTRRNDRTTRSFRRREAVEFGRIVDQNAGAGFRVRDPAFHQVGHVAVVRHALLLHDVRPVGAPDQALRRGRDQRVGRGIDVFVRARRRCR